VPAQAQNLLGYSSQLAYSRTGYCRGKSTRLLKSCSLNLKKQPQLPLNPYPSDAGFMVSASAGWQYGKFSTPALRPAAESDAAAQFTPQFGLSTFHKPGQ